MKFNSQARAEDVIRNVGADEYSVGLMAPKFVSRAVLIDGIDNRAANLLKQEALSIGAEAAVSRDVSTFLKGFSKAAVTGTEKQLASLAGKLSGQPFGCKIVAQNISNALLNYEKQKYRIKCGRKNLLFNASGRPLIMGILNVTPDSFSDGSLYLEKNSAVDRAFEMIGQGADIIDIGGQSSRPGAKTVPVNVELERVLPVIKMLRKKSSIPISVDTFYPDAAERTLGEGADMINDISALSAGKGRMLKLINKYGAALILMHMKGIPANMQKKAGYKDVIGEIYEFLEERAGFALDAGVRKEQLVIDPGFGFGKTFEHNVEILARFDEFKTLGLPVLAGLSRKSFIGTMTSCEEPGKRVFGTVSANFVAAMKGAAIVRVHDVKANLEALKVLEYVKQ